MENRWRGTGIPGVRPHAPHSVRHIRGTEAVKRTGSFQVAADANHNSEEMARKHYARFLPADRNRRVNEVLFEDVLHRLTGTADLHGRNAEASGPQGRSRHTADQRGAEESKGEAIMNGKTLPSNLFRPHQIRCLMSRA